MQAVAFLAARGSNVNAVDDRKETPLHLAARMVRKIRILKERLWLEVWWAPCERCRCPERDAVASGRAHGAPKPVKCSVKERS